MKKNLLFLMILLLPITAKAASMEIQCTSNSITVGESVKCSIVGKHAKVGGAAAKVVSVSNGSITAATPSTCPFGEVKNEEFSCVNEETANSVTFASYTIKSSKEGTMTLTLSEVELVGINGTDYVTYEFPSVSKNITVKAKATQPPSTKPTTRPTMPNSPSPQQPEPQTQATEPQSVQPTTDAPSTEPVTETPVTEPWTDETTTTAVKPSPKTDGTGELKSLTVDGAQLTFNPSNYTYNFTVKSNVKELKVSYVKGNDDQTVVVSNTTLKDGLNKIYVEVTEGDIKKTYTLNATREAGMSTTKLVKIVVSIAGLVGLSYALLKVLKRQ